MLTKLLFCFYTFIALLNISYSETAEIQTHSLRNLTLNMLEPIFESEHSINLEGLASMLKIILTQEQIIDLVNYLIPGGVGESLNDTSCDYQDAIEVDSKEVYEDIVSKNLSSIPMYELIHVPETISNATRLRKIENIIRSPRPTRPRRQIKQRHPSNIPGSSPYVVYDLSPEVYISTSDAHSDQLS